MGINTLVTSLGNINHEKKMIGQIQQSTTKACFSNVPINSGRRLGTHDLKGLEELRDAALRFLQKSSDDSKLTHYSHIQRYLKHGQNNSFELPKPEVLALYYSLVKLHKALKNPSRLRDPNNKNLEIATQANLLVHALNEAQDDIVYVLVSGCFSGQDRGGMVSTHTSNESIVNYLTQSNDDRKAIKRQRASVETTQAKAGHTAEMAGNAGTGFGGEGIKLGSGGIVPGYYPMKAKKALLSKTADYNEHLPKNPSRRFYKKSSFWGKAALCASVIGIPIAVGLYIRSRKKHIGKSPYRHIQMKTRKTNDLSKPSTPAFKPVLPSPTSSDPAPSIPDGLTTQSMIIHTPLDDSSDDRSTPPAVDSWKQRHTDDGKSRTQLKQSWKKGFLDKNNGAGIGSEDSASTEESFSFH